MKATHDDLEGIVRLILSMHDEMDESDRPNTFIDVDYLSNSLQAMLDTPNCLIHYREGGVIIGWVGASPFYPLIEVQEQLFFVRKDKRGSILAKSLYDSYILDAKSKGAVSSLVGHSTQLSPRVAEKFYKGLGYTNTGAIYEKEL